MLVGVGRGCRVQAFATLHADLSVAVLGIKSSNDNVEEFFSFQGTRRGRTGQGEGRGEILVLDTVPVCSM